jgi:flagellar biosynthesis protein FlhG
LFTNSRLDPESLLIETGIDNLKFISSAGDNPGSANIDPERVQTIISFLKQLKAHTVILDLGPGTSFNVLDFFNIHDQCIVMSTPEVTSVMKTFSFVRAALFRKISLHLKDAPELQRLVDHSHPSQADVETCTIDILRENIKKVDGSQTEEVEKIIRSFKPEVIINRVRNKKDLQTGDNLTNLVKKFLDVDLKYLGHVIESDQVRDSVEEMVPFLIKDPQSTPSKNLQEIIGEITNTDLNLVKEDGKILVSKQVRLGSGWGI